jgi:glycosidase
VRVWLVALGGLGGCCAGGEPRWQPLPPLSLAAGEERIIDLGAYVDAGDDATFEAEPGTGVAVGIDGTQLAVAAEAGFSGTTYVDVVGRGRCGDDSRTTLVVTVADAPAVPCATVFTYRARTAPDQVFLAGDFNEWSPTATPMTPDGDTWTATVDLLPGTHPYKVVETAGTAQQWACDPDATGFQCDAGAVFDATCPVGGEGCNSFATVGACDAPTLTATSVAIDRDANRIQVEVAATGAIAAPAATLDGEVFPQAWTGDGFSVDAAGLTDGRHTLRFTAKDAAPVVVPAWLDDRSWDTGLLYFAFVDRFSNGDPGNDAAVGATAPNGDWLGGDWAGLTERLGYLDAMGVSAIWVTAPLAGPAGASPGDCGVTYAGYHGYWPAAETVVEPHFGDAVALDAFIGAAHALGIRVLIDLVANHVHEEHPWVEAHPDWFTEKFICAEDEDGNGVQNWDQRPETCWFTGYLPDLDYTRADVIEATAAGALAMVRDHGFDGFRVDAVKHMSHGLHATLQARIRQNIEFIAAGGDEPFYTVGETFTGDRALISSYIGPAELDGQFDFPLYWGILGAFARDEIGLSNGAGSLQAVSAASHAAYGDAVMSTFLGNHDVARFVTHANGEIGSLYGDGTCASDGGPRPAAVPPAGTDPYDRLRLAWSFLLTTPGLPLIYYGDEIGMPGNADPDNRQMMRFTGELSPAESAVLDQVQALGMSRRFNPAFARGETIGWWEGEADFWAYARTWEGDAVLVLLNRATAAREVTNGLAFAGLPQGTWRDVLTGDLFDSAGDQLTIDVPPRGSRVLVPR